MSDYERHKGKVQKVDLSYGIGILALEEFVKLKLLQDGFISEQDKLSSRDIMDTFRDEYYDKYILVGEDLWEIIENEVLDNDYDFCEIDNISQDTYAYHTSFYNGGTCLTETLQGELSKVVPNEQ